jgi:hypothetical protein
MTRPLFPRGFASQGEPAHFRFPGAALPWSSRSLGLGSKLSTCDVPPFMKKRITRCARARNCEGRAASG